MIAHDELVFCIQQKYPNLIHGTHFLVGHEVKPGTSIQVKDAFIAEWHAGEKPTDKELAALTKQYVDAARQYLRERPIRIERDARLKEADVLLYKAMDSGDAELTKRVGQYRQALRGVPNLPGFPDAFEWPAVPDAEDEAEEPPQGA